MTSPSPIATPRHPAPARRAQGGKPFKKRHRWGLHLTCALIALAVIVGTLVWFWSTLDIDLTPFKELWISLDG